MKRPQWSSTHASVSVENLFNDEIEEDLAHNTTVSEFDGGLEDELSEESSCPMNVDQDHDDSDDVEVETKVLKDNIICSLVK